MKRFASIILLFAILLCLAGCAAAEDNLDDTKRQQLMYDIAVAKTYLDPDNPGENEQIFASGDYYYMGTFGEYIAVFMDGNLFGTWQQQIGEEFFYDSQTSNIALFRDGNYTPLHIAHTNGMISDQDLFTLAKRFYHFQAAHSGIHPELFEEIYGAYKDRYTHNGSEDSSYLDQFTDTDRQTVMYEVICGVAKESFGLDINRPGEGNQIFADAPYYYLGTYAEAVAVLRCEEISTYWEEMIGEEFFCCTAPFLVDLYQNWECVALTHAYKEGSFTDEDLYTLAKRFYQFQLERAEDPEQVRQLYGDYAARYESP